MRPERIDTARALAAQVVARVLDDGAWAQPALSSALQHANLDDRDRGLVTELVYGTLRFALPLEQSLLRAATRPQKGLDRRMRPHLLVAAYQLQHLDERIPAHAAVSAAVSAIKRERKGMEGFANALLRHLGSPLSAQLTPTSTLAELCAAYGVPERLGRAVCHGLPTTDHHAAIAGLKARPRTWAIARGGVVPEGATAHQFVPGMYALDGGKVDDTRGFKDGAFFVMDPGSALCALAAAPASGARVLDVCAAPGGKTVLLAHAVGDGGHVTAVELSARRAARIDDNVARLSLADRVTVVIADALTLDEKPQYDVVLLDAPCSGLGTVRRKPEIALRFDESSLHETSKLQRALLDKAARLTAPGGVLIYSVCSPDPDEGARHIDAFVRDSADFTRELVRDVLDYVPASAVDEHGQLRLLPHRDDCDAFFVARLRRRAS